MVKMHSFEGVYLNMYPYAGQLPTPDQVVVSSSLVAVVYQFKT